MKFTCDKHIMCNELSIASEVISSKSIQVVSSYIQLSLTGSELTFKGTDTHNGFTSLIEVRNSISGICTVHCDKLLGILKTFPDGDIDFEVIDSSLFVKTPMGNVNIELKLYETDSFPALYQAPEDSYITIPQKLLLEAITHASISVAVDSDKSRLMMNGVLLDPREDGLYFVGTDGRRLSLVKGECSGFSATKGVIAHARFYTIMKKFLSGEGDAYISIQAKHLFFKQGNTVMYTTFIDGQFPNYLAVIPNNPFVCTVKRRELYEALKRVQVMVKENTSGKLFVEMSDNAMRIYSEQNEVGQAEETIACEYSGDAFVCALNIDYLLSPIRVIHEEEILLAFKSATHAILLTGVEEKSFKHIIMPMKL